MNEQQLPDQGTTSLIDRLRVLPRHWKILIVVGFDCTACVMSMLLSVYLRVGHIPRITPAVAVATLVAVLMSVPTLAMVGCYKAVFRHIGSAAVVRIGRACAIFAIPYSTVYTLWGIDGVPRTVGLLLPMILFLLLVGGRLLGSEIFRRHDCQMPNGSRVLVYGAGMAGRQLVSAIRSAREMIVIGYIDDNPELVGRTIDAFPVYAIDQVPDLVERRSITHIMLAIPSAGRRRRAAIIEALQPLPVKVQSLPGVMDLARGKVQVSDLHDLDIEDLLGRGAVEPNHGLLEKNIRGKVVLVTGAGGSIGSELCRQVLAFAPECLILVDNSEFALYQINEELRRRIAAGEDEVGIFPYLGSVLDRARMDRLLHSRRPHIIFHAAAYKHVPLVEHNPGEGIRVNVFGTLIMAELAHQHRVSNFVLVSTDKAVRPTNVMGASKRLAEMVLQAHTARGSGTRFSMVRFGNVLGSSGSVVPLFRRQIADGGPITITHREMTRYFMLIPEAAQLVVQAGAMAQGGEVFLLDMGDPVRIRDLARNMIELSGLSVRDVDNPDGDIELLEIGLRPGEKLYEELLISGDPEPTSHPLIMKSRETFMPWEDLEVRLDQLQRQLAAQDDSGAVALLRQIVPDYRPDKGSQRASVSVTVELAAE
ncbi:polysaccharide biosynthesis protein [Sphingosinicella humi]|uniref:Polysaccharide biosynthesis protein n=1 Tax=Allosphingosinicella humi TaxID=2068657 RepID=A0A2U2J189_9SPHN|nr:nucleoside-diphosphate sugar epimerase/dehydratase [Sphingosinicella humi]PWG02109.1 polysaccharide biosynthesis protein [Sphingosinicella humi]